MSDKCDAGAAGEFDTDPTTPIGLARFGGANDGRTGRKRRGEQVFASAELQRVYNEAYNRARNLEVAAEPQPQAVASTASPRVVVDDDGGENGGRMPVSRLLAIKNDLRRGYKAIAAMYDHHPKYVAEVERFITGCDAGAAQEDEVPDRVRNLEDAVFGRAGDVNVHSLQALMDRLLAAVFDATDADRIQAMQKRIGMLEQRAANIQAPAALAERLTRLEEKVQSLEGLDESISLLFRKVEKILVAGAGVGGAGSAGGDGGGQSATKR